MYAKLIDNKLILPPKQFKENGRIIIGGTPEFYKEHGYKEVIFTDYPEAVCSVMEEYEETENSIIIHYFTLPDEQETMSDLDSDIIVNELLEMLNEI